MSHYAFIRYVVGRRRQLFCSTFETWATIDPIEIKEEGVSRTFSENQISYESKEDWRTDDPKNKFSPLSLDRVSVKLENSPNLKTKATFLKTKTLWGMLSFIFKLNYQQIDIFWSSIRPRW